MVVRPWHLLSLCDGYGGTELALRSVAQVRTVCRVERDAYAAAVLVERMEQTRLDSCPIWDDVATFDGSAWRGRVDVVAAGFPCPDFSSAGLRAGVDGEHWLWPECFKVIREVGPRFVLLENVPGLVRLGGLTRVLSDLASIGFDVEWGVLAASAVGAPHERERWWLVAHAGSGRRQAEHQLPGGTRSRVHGNDDRRRPRLAHTNRLVGRRTPGDALDRHSDTERSARPPEPGRCRCIVADTQNHRCKVAEPWRPEPERPWPPSRGDGAGWAEWITTGGPQPVLRRSTNGPPGGLADALHLGGNGLVPQCAAHAWSQLIERGGWSLT